ncbi:DUF5522 domain-containing protein [Pedobacter flavus]|uniref:DUF5522 domain-containing protein n=1 Tax=Pedobacter flavus TaxID=3113906 RepID=A0ABU7H255_9SPHI|nr:DUF5522 domain-containing protein [Pedobacter sp. VNH31]MEE1885235.1 DUF5522 domain-containing protein [Pedobacter sp. VNH31]
MNHPQIVEGEDYYFNEQGLMVFTAQHHLKRGYCCKNGCLNCPWKFKKKQSKINADD